ncbi:EamA family transporter [Effusibacillus consociatus]|uniref:EamA family transporter n=1 Tax=Effusibacillus consociatus TaxID=1117041 RepID=A0ABV9Q679_9BACL
MNYVFLLSNIVLLVAGQVFFKIGLDRIGGVSVSNLWKAALQPYVILGLFLYVAATGLWFIVLSRMSLSVAYPLQSLAYVLGVLIAWSLFGEMVPPIRWIGVLVILVGVALVAWE